MLIFKETDIQGYSQFRKNRYTDPFRLNTLSKEEFCIKRLLPFFLVYIFPGLNPELKLIPPEAGI